MADYNNISLDINPETKIAKLTLRRPEKLNSITREMGLELVDAIEKVSDEKLKSRIFSLSVWSNVPWPPPPVAS